MTDLSQIFVEEYPQKPLESVPAYVYRQLRDQILRGDYQAGQRLQQEEIALQFGISRVPVREALKQLEGEGLVVARPRRGYAVASLNPEDVEEVFDIRRMLEERAAVLGTQRRTKEDVTAAGHLLLAMEEVDVYSMAGLDRFAKLNRDFHYAIIRPSGRNLMLQLMTVLRNKVEPYIRMGAAMAGHMERVKQEHRLIYEAFADGDAAVVGRLSREHVERVCDRLVRFLREQRDVDGEDQPRRAEESSRENAHERISDNRRKRP